MNDDGLKMLALLAAAILGYIYAKGGARKALRQDLLRNEYEKKKADEVAKVNSVSLADLIRRANARLRRRRGASSGKLGDGTGEG